MQFETFSKSQLTALTWWSDKSPYEDKDAIICDGAVRSGKTLCMGISFVCWAMRRFNAQKFAICGKTVTSLRRNLISELLETLRDLGFHCEEKVSRNLVEITFCGNTNTFYYFGGRDEGSAALIQGVTLAGVLLDEVALMPRSFVEQALARCSVDGSRFWFNCNPEGPAHWFYAEWIQKCDEKNALYLKFRLEDNPTLTRKLINRYHNMYSGVFYRRFILGEWVAQEGLIYDFFDESYVVPVPDGNFQKYVVSCDYGTANPTSFGLWAKQNDKWYRIREYYYNSRKVGRQKTDMEYVEALEILLQGCELSYIVVDPSAASFIECLRRSGYNVRKANNEVVSGIRKTADMLRHREINICKTCEDSIREFSLYRWNESETGKDAPMKLDDHTMDDIRYFAMSLNNTDNFASISVWREK